MLTSLHLTTLHSLLDCLIPPDDDPGAWDAGVGDYLLRQLAGDLATELEAYRAGLDGLEAEAQACFGASFSALPGHEQAALLRQVEAGQVSQGWATDPALFFRAAVQHAAEGYYSDPGNGGNRDGAVWRMIGFVPGKIQP
jgi:hypothetical protein